MIIIFTLLVVLIDLGSKFIVSHTLNTGESISLINNFLSITYVKNTGAAFSIFADKSFIVTIISAIIMILIIMYVYRSKPVMIGEKIGYAFIIGGAIGNFSNRLVRGYVIDFIDVVLFGYDYPIFNLADSFIVLGVVILIIITWRCNYGNKGNGR